MNIAIVYWSGTGNTKAMAEALADALQSRGAQHALLGPGEFDAKGFDAVALGCPSMGAEELEDSEFAPMYEAQKGALAGKPVALFGSYGWGDGEWMRTWQADAEGAGLRVLDAVIARETPDAEALAALDALADKLAHA